MRRPISELRWRTENATVPWRPTADRIRPKMPSAPKTIAPAWLGKIAMPSESARRLVVTALDELRSRSVVLMARDASAVVALGRTMKSNCVRQVLV